MSEACVGNCSMVADREEVAILSNVAAKSSYWENGTSVSQRPRACHYSDRENCSYSRQSHVGSWLVGWKDVNEARQTFNWCWT